MFRTSRQTFDRFCQLLKDLKLDMDYIRTMYKDSNISCIKDAHPKWGPEALKMSRDELKAVLCIDFPFYEDDNVLRCIWIELQKRREPIKV